MVLTALALAFLSVATSYGDPQPAGTSEAGHENTITIRIHNYANTNPSIVRHARETASDVLRHAGVNSVWLECPVGAHDSPNASCEQPFSPLTFQVNLIPRPMSTRLHVLPGVLGLAAETGDNGFASTAFIFYDDAKSCAEKRREDFDELLGSIIAHELGHLLLGTNSHSSMGLMSNFWSSKQLLTVQQRGLHFSIDEAERARQAILARKLASTATQASARTAPVSATNAATQQLQTDLGGRSYYVPID